MTEFYEDTKTQLPSLWRVKLEAYFWTILFGTVFFVAFYSIRGSIQISNPFGDLMQPQEWTMTIVFLAAITCTLVFNKVYYLFNREVFQSNTQTLRLIHTDVGNLKSQINDVKNSVSLIYDLVVTEPRVGESD